MPEQQVCSEPLFHIALYQPEIPQNTGNIGRLALGTGAHLHLIHPLGFNTDEKSVRRAGLDYWSSVQLTEHSSEKAFWTWIDSSGCRPVLFSTKSRQSFTEFVFQKNDVLLFGPESRGLPEPLLEQHEAVTIPMLSTIRSLNLANAVSVATYEVLQQLHPGLFLAQEARG